MKKINCILLLLFGVMIFGQTKGIKFENDSFLNLLKKAKNENKLIFIDAYTTWCGPCKLMAKNIFPLESVGNYYNSHFINTKIDMEKGEGINLAKKYNIKAFPTFLFIDSNGTIVQRGTGGHSELEFIDLAKKTEDPNKNFQELSKRYEKGERSQELIKNLYYVTRNIGDEFSKNVILDYFNVVPDEEITNSDVKYLTQYNSINSSDPAYKIVISRADILKKLIGEKEYKNIIDRIKVNDIILNSFDPVDNKFNDSYFLIEAEKIFSPNKAKDELLTAKMNISLTNKDYQSFEKIVLEKYNIIPEDTSADDLFQAAYRFNLLVSNHSSLKKAIIWCKESIRKDENSGNTKTLAELYNKIGDKVNSKKWAKRSVELSKKSGKDFSEVEKLLKTL